MGGSENMLTEVAIELARHHEVTVRLPYAHPETSFRRVRWVGLDHPAMRGDVLFCFDDFAPRDDGVRRVLVATRSDPPRHSDFDQLVFYSKTHAKLMGHPTRPAIGGGVRLSDYSEAVPRVPQRVIYTSSPDRGGHHAAAIGRDFDFMATYRGCNELSRNDLRRLQQSAMVQIHPYDAPRESEFFCMSVLEAQSAGVPCVLSDGPALVELWGESSIILPKPIDYSEWTETIENLLDDEQEWQRLSLLGKKRAEFYDWPLVAQRYLALALAL